MYINYCILASGYTLTPFGTIIFNLVTSISIKSLLVFSVINVGVSSLSYKYVIKPKDK